MWVAVCKASWFPSWGEFQQSWFGVLIDHLRVTLLIVLSGFVQDNGRLKSDGRNMSGSSSSTTNPRPSGVTKGYQHILYLGSRIKLRRFREAGISGGMG